MDKSNIMFTTPITKGWTRFCDIPEGGHFQDNHGRKFIKLKLRSAMGVEFKVARVWDELQFNNHTDTFNAVDYDGIGGKCPEWCPFKIIRKRK